ncbi:hypothetical protein SAMN05421788_105249 [Filimonas lacunae]|uniref:ABC-2 type transport system permease protein n=1 Tax=Filimonas lacunae TaxID=477680 RepID=A0A173MCJ7_9BACT|nr:hypothetical protein [Filimonas lacunae]BAV05292.1 hypothetical protein FLA_1299 [Filimonas lacunae]SIT22163.1 hypothetical protein SAMN05421788_105249 [Filimonas lacunae]
MSYPFRLLRKSLVAPFYKENMSLFFFLITVMFCVVNVVDGAGLFEYHYSLTLGMLTGISFMLLVFVAWLLYARKCAGFVAALLQRQDYAFVHIYRCKPLARQMLLFMGVSLLLLLPLFLYGLFVVYVGWHSHHLPATGVVWGYLLLLAGGNAVVWVYRLHHPATHKAAAGLRLGRSLLSRYPFMLLQQVLEKQKVLWLSIKVYSCGVLFLIARNNTEASYDFSFPFLFFLFGVFANGIIIHRLREFEETHLFFYRSMPVSLGKKWAQYCSVYAVLLLPEMITVLQLTPVHLHVADAIWSNLAVYSLLLLMNSIAFVRSFSARQYLKVLLYLFFVYAGFLICSGLPYLCVLGFVAAWGIFNRFYYRFQPAGAHVHRM